MAPDEHIDWLEDNIDRFEQLPMSSFDVAVPSCPGWDVEQVMNHLTFGLGLCYPHGLTADPDAAQEQIFAAVQWPDHMPSGDQARAAFARHMSECAATFRATDPLRACATYAGPGQAGFWFRRAAVETTLHRMDVANALGIPRTPLAADRAIDAVTETIDFALPLAALLVGPPTASLAIMVDGWSQPRQLGDGSASAELRGTGETVLSALWGRDSQSVALTGDTEVADSWMNLIGLAFSGR